MRDFVVHLAWLCTHAIRTLLDRDNTPSLLASLSEEVKVLQAELHRAHRLIEGYNLAFEREERAGQFHLRGLEVFTCIIAILTGLLAWAWLCPRRPTPPGPVKAITGDTGGSSESEELSDDQRPPLFVATALRGGGPTRPSALGKGRKK